jgi:ATP-dependent protease ClpP protease subunit
MSIVVRASSAKSAEIVIFGAIGEGLFVEGTTAKTVKERLDALGPVEQIDVRINSPGGNFWDGLAIYNLIKQHAAKVTVFIDALAASAASVIAIAGERSSWVTARS